MITISNFDPAIHGNQVIGLFEENDDNFGDREINYVKADINNPGSVNEQKYVASNLDSQVVGYIVLTKSFDSKTVWVIDWLVVSKKSQKQGVGKLLFDYVKNIATINQGTSLIVDTCSCQDSLGARNFYQKQGMKQYAFVPDFYTQDHSKVSFIVFLSDKIKIQKLNKSHIDQILELESHSAPQLPTYYPFDRHELESVTFGEDTKVTAFGAFDGPKLVGWSTYKSEGNGVYQMAGMVIDKDYRRQGIGEKLFKLRFDEILAKPDRVKIYTTNYPKNTPIIMLYLSHGFSIEDFKKDVYGPGADRLYLSYYPKL